MPGLAGLSNQSWDRSRWAGFRAIFAMFFLTVHFRGRIDDRNVPPTARTRSSARNETRDLGVQRPSGVRTPAQVSRTWW